MKLFLTFAIVLMLVTLCFAEGGIFGEKADVPLPCGGKTPFQWWLDRHAAFITEAKKGEAQICFFGDSLTDFWAKEGNAVWEKEYVPQKAANFGIGGDQTQYVLYRMTNGELEGMKAKVIVIQIGTNNIVKSYTPEETAVGIKAIVDLVRAKLPESKVLVMALLPQGATSKDPSRVKLDQVSELISKLDDGKMVKYLNINSKFVDAEGNLLKEMKTEDRAHLSEKGYQAWADGMRETLAELMK